MKDRKILLADDNEIDRRITTRILQRHGAAVSGAEHGLHALAMLKNEQFDLLLLDLQMPVLDGFKTIKIIRNEMKNPIPVIALSADIAMEDNKKCLEAGMNDFITKPYTEEQLIRIISKWIEKEAIHFTRKIEENIPAQEAPLYDISKLQKTGDEGFVKMMLQLFVTEITIAVADIKAAYHASDFEKLKYLSHRIRPSVLNMGIYRLKTEVTDIEELAGKAEKNLQLTQMIEKLDTVIGQVVAKLREEYPFLN